MKTISSLRILNGKTVLLRIDSDVDIKDGRIIDDTRLMASIPTVEELLAKGADINIIGHLGRPEGVDEEYSMYPIAKWFDAIFKGSIHPIAIGEFKGWRINGRINIFENLRFYKEEEANDDKFSRELGLLGEVYVNDAFAVSHRAHASIVGITKYLQAYAGLHLKKEIEVLSEVLKNPKRPLVVIIGGAKIETKLPLVEKMHEVADTVLVGGEIAEQDRVLIKVQHEKIPGGKSMVLVAELTPTGFDITPKSTENFKQVLQGAAMIVWNGPMGVIRDKHKRHGEDTELATRELAKFITTLDCYKIVGGGDTLSYLSELNLLSKFDFVSTGGGAMLEFLSGQKLPGIVALTK